MKRLHTVLPDWTRVQWTSIENKNKYEPIIASINKAWQHIERMSVVHDIRTSALGIIKISELSSIIDEYAKYGVIVAPLAKEYPSQGYTSSTVPPKQKDPIGVRVVFTKSEKLADEWFRVWNLHASARDREVGILLGYPTCCTKHYAEYTNQQHFVDMTWPVSINGLSAADETLVHIKADTPVESNMLWHWQGVRLVPHIPCSFDCQESMELGKKMAELGRTLGIS